MNTKVNPFQILWMMRHNTYIENISQLSHSIQCANLAKRDNHRHSLVLACLFHDLGHYDGFKNRFQSMVSDTNKYLGIKNHEYVSYSLLKQEGFPEETCQFVKNHVLSKRYLCTVDKNYYNKLSDQSKSTFKVQGGFLSDKQLLSFEKSKYFSGSIILRTYDDLSKEACDKSQDELYKELMLFKEDYELSKTWGY